MRRSLERFRPLLWLGIGMVLGYGLLVHWWWTAPMLALGDQIAEVRDEELGLRMEGEQIPQLRKQRTPASSPSRTRTSPPRRWCSGWNPKCAAWRRTRWLARSRPARRSKRRAATPTRA
jgi:hypothetical protein